jgi:hypothetical protein
MYILSDATGRAAVCAPTTGTELRAFRVGGRAGRLVFAAMSEAEGVVRQTFAALDARDLDAFRELLHPDAEDRFLALA